MLRCSHSTEPLRWAGLKGLGAIKAVLDHKELLLNTVRRACCLQGHKLPKDEVQMGGGRMPHPKSH